MELQRITEKLDRESQKMEQYFSSLSDLQMEILVYTDDQKWKIRDILAHFISAEKSFLQLFDNIRSGGDGTPESFSINEFNNSQVLKMKDLDTGELLGLFKETRSRTLVWLKELKEEQLGLSGKHPSMGEVTLGEMLKMIYLHNQMHLRDIKSVIEG